MSLSSGTGSKIGGAGSLGRAVPAMRDVAARCDALWLRLLAQRLLIDLLQCCTMAVEMLSERCCSAHCDGMCWWYVVPKREWAFQCVSADAKRPDGAWSAIWKDLKHSGLGRLVVEPLNLSVVHGGFGGSGRWRR